MVSAVSKISAFWQQGPQFDPWPWWALNILFLWPLSALANSAFHPSGVGKMSASTCWDLTCDELVFYSMVELGHEAEKTSFELLLCWDLNIYVTFFSTL